MQEIAWEVGERWTMVRRVGEKEMPLKQQGAAKPSDSTFRDERKGAEELEDMLLQVTQEAERRSKELELMTERWLSEKRFSESVLESLSSGLITLDDRGRITNFNGGAERILQYSADEVLGKPLSAAMASKDKCDILGSQGMQDESFFGREIYVMRKDGVEIPAGIDISPQRDIRGRETGKIIHFRDLTKIKEMQEELLRVGRLGSLGEISMGIAHEIRNPLAGIRITAQAMEEEVKDNQALKEYVARIISEIDRLNELVKSFMSFAKPQKPELAPCQLPELLQDVLFLVKKDLEKRKIRVEQEHTDDLPSVSLDVNQMKQVFLNLILNSIESITKQGEIRVRTSVISRRDRREVMISVSDSGKGIPEELQSKVFDPFFTTKARGLGMGLSNVYRIINRHDGYIRVQSESRKGTTFFIHLPLDDGAKE
jgi:two-component system sensor histidine kinase HydH